MGEVRTIHFMLVSNLPQSTSYVPNHKYVNPIGRTCDQEVNAFSGAFTIGTDRKHKARLVRLFTQRPQPQNNPCATKEAGSHSQACRAQLRCEKHVDEILRRYHDDTANSRPQLREKGLMTHEAGDREY